jgi:hypothetical protein
MFVAFAKALEVFCIVASSIGLVIIIRLVMWMVFGEEPNNWKYQRLMGFLLGGEFVALLLSFWLDSWNLWG